VSSLSPQWCPRRAAWISSVIVLSSFALSTGACRGRTGEEAIETKVRQILETVQDDSIERDIEFCGYIVIRPDNVELEVIGPTEGNRFQCKTPLVYKPYKILASFHTHGGADPEASTEFPSSIDFDAARAEGHDAFVGTPGGRIWRINHETGVAAIVCGPENCLRQDPRLLAEPVPKELTRSDVLKIEKKLRFLR
jgi:hypothetical protein